MSKGTIPDIKELLLLRHHGAKISFLNPQRVHSSLSGDHLSPARGRGMDFEEVRRYQAGDDIRLIHWPLTARLGKPFTKIYREERERAVYLLIDQSQSMQFGTRVCFKSVLAAKIAAILGWAALAHHEQVGAIIFNENHAEVIKPRRSRQALMAIFNQLANPEKISRHGGGLANVLQRSARDVPSGSIVILISDYFGCQEDEESYLRLIAAKCELINLFIYDPLERALPERGQYSFCGMDATKRLELTTGDKTNRLYAANFLSRQNRIKDLAIRQRMQLVMLATNDDLVQKINQGIIKYGY